ncbi:hypothetical protein [Gramella sp. KN1008]|nr:hypothetical protein [Gramella sp. KN1008]
MKLKEEEKEKLKKDIQNSDPKRQEREFMDEEQRQKEGNRSPEKNKKSEK